MSLTRLFCIGSLLSGPGTLVTPGQRVRDAAQQTFFLLLLPVALSLRLPSFFFRLAGLLLLRGFFPSIILSLLRPTFLLLVLVAGQGSVGFFRLAFGLLTYSYSFLLQFSRARDYWFAAAITSLTVTRPSAPEPCT